VPNLSVPLKEAAVIVIAGCLFGLKILIVGSWVLEKIRTRSKSTALPTD